MALEAPANRVQLRCYLGSVLYQPDNVRIMPNCPIEGIIKEEWVTKTNFENLLPAISNQSCNKQIRLRQCTVRSREKRYFNSCRHSRRACKGNGLHELAIYERRLLHKGLSRYTVYSDNSGVPGAVVQHNNAEFGRLDHPELYMGLHGVPATYENADFDRKVTTR